MLLLKNYMFLAWLPGISANSKEHYRRYNLQAFADILGKFPEILNFWKNDPKCIYC